MRWRDGGILIVVENYWLFIGFREAVGVWGGWRDFNCGGLQGLDVAGCLQGVNVVGIMKWCMKFILK